MLTTVITIHHKFSYELNDWKVICKNEKIAKVKQDYKYTFFICSNKAISFFSKKR